MCHSGFGYPQRRLRVSALVRPRRVCPRKCMSAVRCEPSSARRKSSRSSLGTVRGRSLQPFAGPARQVPVQTIKHLRSASELSARETPVSRIFGVPGYRRCRCVRRRAATSNRVRRARIRRAKNLRLILSQPCPVDFCQAPRGYGCATRSGSPATRPHKARRLARPE
jgi:hypothetical protein